MKRIIVNVPEKKFDEFLKLMAENGYKTQEEDFDIPEWHKEIVRERIRTAKEEDYIPWEEVKKNLGIK
jgi:hypothetical protein